ncbi:hypothetical protein, partial [Mycobacterium tuberculosis]|uniref:hypothetical protein n=2 Tax=Mycobacterium tuberculosis TaxID=1773 RepID=UPI0039E0D831
MGFTPNKPIASGDAGIEIDPTLMTWNADSSRPIEFRVIGGMLMGPTSAPVLLMPSPMAGTVIGGTLIGPTNAPELLMPRPISGMVNRPGMSGDSSSWKGWGHVRWFIEE